MNKSQYSKKPILSVCIPTYNRPEDLKQLLESFLDAPLEQIEFVVADNGTRSQTEPVLSEFKEKGFNIIPIFQEENIGVPKNLLSALRAGTGEYLWLMGDDDIVVSENIPEMLSSLKAASPDVFIVNFSTWNHDFSVQIQKKAFSLSQNYLPGKLTRETGIMVLTFIGSLVLKNEEKYISAMQKCLGNDFCYILSALTAGLNKVDIYEKIMVRQRMRLRQTWHKSCQKIFISDLNEIYRLAREIGYQKKFLKEWQSDYLKDALTRICLSDKASSGKTDSCILRGLLSSYYHSLYLWMVTIPLYLMPVFLLKMLKSTFSWNKKVSA